ncbi:hypothetical protein SCLCIDRAFT_1222672, partial [Scleroderma citrinum Foug A]
MDEHDGRNVIAIVAICPCASWLDKSSSSLLSVPAAALAAQEHRHCHRPLAAQERCCCRHLSMRQLVGQVVVLACLVARHPHCHPHLSLRQPKSLSLSVLWLVVAICHIAVPLPLPLPSIPAPATQVIAVITAVYPVAHRRRLPVVRVVIAVCPSGSLSSSLSRWLVEIVGIGVGGGGVG